MWRVCVQLRTRFLSGWLVTEKNVTKKYNKIFSGRYNCPEKYLSSHSSREEQKMAIVEKYAWNTITILKKKFFRSVSVEKWFVVSIIWFSTLYTKRQLTHWARWLLPVPSRESLLRGDSRRGPMHKKKVQNTPSDTVVKRSTVPLSVIFPLSFIHI